MNYEIWIIELKNKRIIEMKIYFFCFKEERLTMDNPYCFKAKAYCFNANCREMNGKESRSIVRAKEDQNMDMDE